MRRYRVSLLFVLLGVACYNDDEHRGIVDPTAVGILTVTTSAATIPADGASTSTITARIDPRTPASKRTVTFKTSAGTIVGATAEAGRQLAVTADAQGEATAVLRSSTLVEAATVTVLIEGFLSIATVNFAPVVVGDVITLQPGMTQAPGDGATIVPITVQIAPQLVQRTVTLATTDGKFLPGEKDTLSVTPDSSNRATVDLRAPLAVTNARITATVSGTSTETRINFVAAPPEAVTLAPATFDVPTNKSVTITATLRRTTGKVTPGQTLAYTATDTTGATIGFFTNAAPSDATEHVTVLFVPNGAPVGTIVTITGSVNATTVLGQTTVRVVAAAP
jgi:hypothetical protein